MSMPFALRLAAWLALLCTGGMAAAATPDLTTADGFSRACAVAPAPPFRTESEKVTAVICRDTALARQVATWLTQGLKQIERDRSDSKAIMTEVQREIDYVRAELAATRNVLEQIKLGKRTSLSIAPGQWALDLDSDGQIAVWEQHFFAIPKRGRQPMRFGAPSNDPAYYAGAYQTDAVIKVDQSDILWALSYHHFVEGFLSNLRAFDLLDGFKGVVIARPELLKSAHRLIGRGMVLSAAMRQSVLAETDDDHEWIGNPGQASSVFPIPLDASDFSSWGKVMQELIALWQGRTLLPTTERGAGLLAELAPLCPEGMALDIAATYLQPPAAGTVLALGSRARLSARHCVKVTAARPVSSLPALIEQAQKTDAGMHFLRYLYWTN